MHGEMIPPIQLICSVFLINSCNLHLWAKPSPLSALVSKVLLEHATPFFAFVNGCFPTTATQWNAVTRIAWSTKPTILPIWLFTEKFAQPCSRGPQMPSPPPQLSRPTLHSTPPKPQPGLQTARGRLQKAHKRRSHIMDQRHKRKETSWDHQALSFCFSCFPRRGGQAPFPRFSKSCTEGKPRKTGLGYIKSSGVNLSTPGGPCC